MLPKRFGSSGGSGIEKHGFLLDLDGDLWLSADQSRASGASDGEVLSGQTPRDFAGAGGIRAVWGKRISGIYEGLGGTERGRRLTRDKSYFALCIHDRENELVDAECAALTGSWPEDDGFVECSTIERVSRAAYVTFGATALAQAPTLDGLLGQIAQLNLQAEAFRVEIVVLCGGEPVPGFQTMTAVADLIDGGAELVAPLRRFVIVSRSEGYWFGEIFECPNSAWKRHDQKPLRTSSSLPSRLCRAIVNLAVQPGDVVLNPCCGTGSILLEAASMGVEAYGIDHNPKMIWMTRRNLAHFGYAVSVEQGESKDWTRRGDVLLADLPYDRNCLTTDDNVREVLNSSAPLAQRAVFIAEIDLTDWLHQAGYTKVRVYRVPKTPRFTRYVHSVVGAHE